MRQRARGSHVGFNSPIVAPQCQSRSGVWRSTHSFDKDGVCLFCDQLRVGYRPAEAKAADEMSAYLRRRLNTRTEEGTKIRPPQPGESEEVERWRQRGWQREEDADGGE